MRHFTIHLLTYLSKIFKKKPHFYDIFVDIMSKKCDNIDMG
jgi:hypothetical protein